MDIFKPYSKIRGRIAEIGLVQADFAAYLHIHPTLLNAILKGRRPAPAGFEARANALLDRLEAAEKAAQAARERVLAGEGS